MAVFHRGDSVPITASILNAGTRTITRVDFYVDSILVGSASIPPFSMARPFNDGWHVLYAVAIVAGGAEIRSAFTLFDVEGPFRK